MPCGSVISAMHTPARSASGLVATTSTGASPTAAIHWRSVAASGWPSSSTWQSRVASRGSLSGRMRSCALPTGRLARPRTASSPAGCRPATHSVSVGLSAGGVGHWVYCVRRSTKAARSRSSSRLLACAVPRHAHNSQGQRLIARLHAR